MIRVYIATASTLAHAGLEALLGAYADIEIVSTALEADVLISESGDVSAGSVPVILLTDDAGRRHLRWPVRAVLARDAAPSQIAAAIQAVAAGLIVVSSNQSARLLGLQEPGDVERLTGREIEVLEMLTEGLSNKMIAYRLSISENTAKFHVNSILTKMNAGTRTEAVIRGVRLGLIKI